VRREPFDDSQPRPQQLIDDQPFSAYVLERLSEKVVSFEAHHDRLEQPLASADRAQGAADMLREHKPSARAKHPCGSP
jgi:hypothetical protein